MKNKLGNIVGVWEEELVNMDDMVWYMVFLRGSYRKMKEWLESIEIRWMKVLKIGSFEE